MKNTKEIQIFLNEKSKIYNQFNDNQLSDELSQYIYNQCRGLSFKTNIALHIKHNFKIEETEKEKLVDKIRENFGIDVKENLIKLNNEHIRQAILIFLGVILLLISKFLNNNFYVIGQIVSIFGWVMIWEFAYSFIFQMIQTRMQNKRYKSLIKAKIYFEQIDSH